MKIEISIKNKRIGFRGREIQKLLRPLAGKNGAPAFNIKQQRYGLIIATHDGAPVQSDYRSWRFSTFTRYFNGSYFEFWKPQENGIYIMDRAYLSLYKIDRALRKEREYFSLHCDPYEPLDAPHAIYKKGPHLHIQTASPPIPHSHIALNRCDLEETLSSLRALSDALNKAIIMLKEEILDAHNSG